MFILKLSFLYLILSYEDFDDIKVFIIVVLNINFYFYMYIYKNLYVCFNFVN